MNSEENSKRKVPHKTENQTLNNIKRMNIYNNCHIPDLVQTFCYEENGSNLV